MSNYRRTSKKSRWYLNNELYDTVLHYARNYPVWKAEYEFCDINGAIRYDKERVQTSGDFDPTETTGIRHAMLRDKLNKIEEAAQVAAPEETLRHFLILGVCYGKTWYQLRELMIPCNRNEYASMRGRFYYELAQSI